MLHTNHGRRRGIRVGEVGENLDRNFALKAGVLGAPDHAHTSLTDLVGQAVMEELLTRLNGHFVYSVSQAGILTDLGGARRAFEQPDEDHEVRNEQQRNEKCRDVPGRTEAGCDTGLGRGIGFVTILQTAYIKSIST